MPTVPTIDISRIDEQTLVTIDQACRDHGFFKLVGHGLNDLIDQMWQQSRLFFAAPIDWKQGLIRSENNPFGFFNRELTKQKRDQKETFDYHHNAALHKQATPWPALPPQSQSLQPGTDNGDLAAFEATLKNYYEANATLAAQVLQLICQAMGAAPDSLSELFNPRHTSLARLNHYPSYDPLPAAQRGDTNALGDMALHHHTDPGAITLLYQDDIGGLQTLSDSEGWIDVPPEPYSFVVNLGDLMQVWSNDRYKAAVHQVVPVPAGRSRYSMPFFYSPMGRAVISPILPGQASHYREFTYGEFATARSQDNYSDLDQDDTQISDYRLEPAVS